MKTLTVIIVLLLVTGCATNQINQKREILEASHPSTPEWVEKNDSQWEDDLYYYIKSQYTIRGDQRINSCFDLAKLDAAQQLTSQITSDLKGEFYNLSGSTSEDEIEAFTKSVSNRFEGELRGLTLKKQYFERYQINGVERITCFTQHSIEKKNMANVQRKARNIASDVQKELTKKQVEFINEKQ